MVETIAFTDNEIQWLKEVLGNILPDMIYDDASDILEQWELIKLAEKFNISFDKGKVKQ